MRVYRGDQERLPERIGFNVSLKNEEHVGGKDRGQSIFRRGTHLSQGTGVGAPKAR